MARFILKFEEDKRTETIKIYKITRTLWLLVTLP